MGYDRGKAASIVRTAGKHATRVFRRVRLYGAEIRSETGTGLLDLYAKRKFRHEITSTITYFRRDRSNSASYGFFPSSVERLLAKRLLPDSGNRRDQCHQTGNPDRQTHRQRERERGGGDALCSRGSLDLCDAVGTDRVNRDI